MNIKIDKQHRIRLDKTDLESFLEKKCLKESFKLTPHLLFEVEILLEEKKATSHIKYEDNKISFVLSKPDLEQITNGQNKKNGFTLDNYNIQLDLWDSKKRIHPEKIHGT